MTRGIFQAVNRFITSLDVGSFIDNNSDSGYFDITDKTVDGFELTDGKCRAYMTVDFGIEGSEEIFRINEVDGYRCYFDKRISVGGNGKQIHISSSSVRINDVAEYINDLSEFVDTFGYSEQLTNTTFIVHGGRIQIGNEVVELGDKVFTLGSEGFLINQTHTLFVNQTTKQFEVNAVVPETGIILAEIITDNDKIVTLTRKMPAYVSMYGYSVLDVNGKTGSVILDKGDVALGNVDNTSDADKPLSNISAEYFNNIMNQGGYGAEIEGENLFNLEDNGIGCVDGEMILPVNNTLIDLGSWISGGGYNFITEIRMREECSVYIYSIGSVVYGKVLIYDGISLSVGSAVTLGNTHTLLSSFSNFDETRFFWNYQDSNTSNASYIMFEVTGLSILSGSVFVDPRNGNYLGFVHRCVKADTINNMIISLFYIMSSGSGSHNLYTFSVSGLTIGASSTLVYDMGASYSADFYTIGKKSMLLNFYDGSSYYNYEGYVSGGSIVFNLLGSGSGSSVYALLKSPVVFDLGYCLASVHIGKISTTGSDYLYYFIGYFFSKDTNRVMGSFGLDTLTLNNNSYLIEKINNKSFYIGWNKFYFEQFAVLLNDRTKTYGPFFEADYFVNKNSLFFSNFVRNGNTCSFLFGTYVKENFGIMKDGKLRLKGAVEVPGVEKGKEYGFLFGRFLEEGGKNMGIAIDDGLFLLK